VRALPALDVCRNCNTVVLASSSSCLRCGRQADAGPGEIRGCPACGVPVVDDARFCANCGQLVEGVGRVPNALLHDPPKPPDPAKVWVDRSPSLFRLWPLVVLLGVLALLITLIVAARMFAGS
jgi:hypothetical protein